MVRSLTCPLSPLTAGSSLLSSAFSPSGSSMTLLPYYPIVVIMTSTFHTLEERSDCDFPHRTVSRYTVVPSVRSSLLPTTSPVRMIMYIWSRSTPFPCRKATNWTVWIYPPMACLSSKERIRRY